MPIIIHRKPIREFKKYQRMEVRDFSAIDVVVRRTIGAIKENSPIPDTARRSGIKFIWIFNNSMQMGAVVPREPESCLVESCLARGLNLREVESWLDYFYTNNDGRVHFSPDRLDRVNAKKPDYISPAGIISTLIQYRVETQ